MDFIEEAKKLGFSDAAVMKTDKLVFVPEYRVFCEENACGNYDKNPACPPESGTVEEMKERALDYENTLVLQTTQDRLMDYRKAKLAHNKLTEQLSEKMKAVSYTHLAEWRRLGAGTLCGDDPTSGICGVPDDVCHDHTGTDHRRCGWKNAF